MNFHARANKIMDLAWDVVLGWEDVVLGEGWLLSVGVGGQDKQYQTLLIARGSDRKSAPNHGGVWDLVAGVFSVEKSIVS